MKLYLTLNGERRDILADPGGLPVWADERAGELMDVPLLTQQRHATSDALMEAFDAGFQYRHALTNGEREEREQG